MKDKRKKRWNRENRPEKRDTWKCSCGARHPIGTPCPHPKTS